MKNKRFEKWYLTTYCKNQKVGSIVDMSKVEIKAFNELPFSMQWGVYLEFLTTYNIWIELKLLSWNGGWYSNVSGNWVDGDMKMEKAQKNAVEKGMELVDQIIERRKN